MWLRFGARLFLAIPFMQSLQLRLRNVSKIWDNRNVAFPACVAWAMKILLVEDRPDTRELLALALRGGGYDVTEAYDVKTAVAALATPDCCEAVISDVGLPGGSGLEIAETAMRLGVPVLLCTGHPDAMMLLEARNIRYLRKPFVPSAMLDWLAEISSTSG